jgi:glucose-6-phosphate isomerase
MIEKLDTYFQITPEPRISELFKKDPNRLDKYSIRLDSGDHFLFFDFSKNLIEDETFEMLLALAKEKHVFEKIQEMFNGEKINTTEDRAVLHIALRNRSNRSIFVDGKDVMPDVNAVLEKMRIFVNRVRSGEWKGYTGKPIHDVINIGIGGSDLGPQMVSLALTPYANAEHISVHYISNVDGTHAAEVFKRINPETCLFIVASKTFTTQVCIILFLFPCLFVCFGDGVFSTFLYIY